MSGLHMEIKYLPGIGPKRAEILANDAGIETVEDFLFYFPYKHVDRTKFYKINELNADLPYIQLIGKIISYEEVGEAHKKRLVAQFTDGTGVIELVWFKGLKWIKQTYKLNQPYIIYGKPTLFKNKFNIAHPEIDTYDDDEKQQKGYLQPFYHTSERMKNNFLTSRAIHRYIAYCIDKYIHELEETLPDYLLQQCRLMPLKEAIYYIHFPQTVDDLKKAEYRLKFEELFTIQLNLAYQKTMREKVQTNLVCSKVGECFNRFYSEKLPFQLTDAQKRVIREIRHDMGSGRQMNRLLQGDVGSGKTLVALMVALIAIDNGFQACFMVPTEILANQHYANIRELLNGLDVNVELLTGSTPRSKRKIIYTELLNGQIQMVIGTHALIEETVQFKNLGLVIIDEQHRFGVAQRARLWQKNEFPPHVLVMTATPIPRTLAMTLYGDLDVSVIDQLPPGRKPIYTKHFTDLHRNKINELILREVEKGRQIYVVYPLIQESEKSDLKDLERGYQYFQKHFPQLNVCMVHGKMKPAEKDAAMQGFLEGRYHILVSTTVIEVGVNVPNATVMIIENAERFGLSQLHQLRGRVGRGGEQSFCLLVTNHKLSEDSRRRMQIMESTTDGFVIAEADLKMRGPGDIDGTQQSGMPFELHIANLAKDQQLLQYARQVAMQIIKSDPLLANPGNTKLKILISKTKKENVNWRLIS